MSSRRRGRPAAPKGPSGGAQSSRRRRRRQKGSPHPRSGKPPSSHDSATSVRDDQASQDDLVISRDPGPSLPDVPGSSPPFSEGDASKSTNRNPNALREGEFTVPQPLSLDESKGGPVIPVSFPLALPKNRDPRIQFPNRIQIQNLPEAQPQPEPPRTEAPPKGSSAVKPRPISIASPKLVSDARPGLTSPKLKKNSAPTPPSIAIVRDPEVAAAGSVPSSAVPRRPPLPLPNLMLQRMQAQTQQTQQVQDHAQLQSRGPAQAYLQQLVALQQYQIHGQAHPRPQAIAPKAPQLGVFPVVLPTPQSQGRGLGRGQPPPPPPSGNFPKAAPPAMNFLNLLNFQGQMQAAVAAAAAAAASASGSSATSLADPNAVAGARGSDGKSPPTPTLPTARRRAKLQGRIGSQPEKSRASGRPKRKRTRKRRPPGSGAGIPFPVLLPASVRVPAVLAAGSNPSRQPVPSRRIGCLRNRSGQAYGPVGGNPREMSMVVTKARSAPPAHKAPLGDVDDYRQLSAAVVPPVPRANVSSNVGAGPAPSPLLLGQLFPGSVMPTLPMPTGIAVGPPKSATAGPGARGAGRGRRRGRGRGSGPGRGRGRGGGRRARQTRSFFIGPADDDPDDEYVPNETESPPSPFGRRSRPSALTGRKRSRRSSPEPDVHRGRGRGRPRTRRQAGTRGGRVVESDVPLKKRRRVQRVDSDDSDLRGPWRPYQWRSTVYRILKLNRGRALTAGDVYHDIALRVDARHVPDHKKPGARQYTNLKEYFEVNTRSTVMASIYKALKDAAEELGFGRAQGARGVNFNWYPYSDGMPPKYVRTEFLASDDSDEEEEVDEEVFPSSVPMEMPLQLDDEDRVIGAELCAIPVLGLDGLVATHKMLKQSMDRSLSYDIDDSECSNETVELTPEGIAAICQQRKISMECGGFTFPVTELFTGPKMERYCNALLFLGFASRIVLDTCATVDRLDRFQVVFSTRPRSGRVILEVLSVGFPGEMITDPQNALIAFKRVVLSPFRTVFAAVGKLDEYASLEGASTVVSLATRAVELASTVEFPVE